MATGPFRSVPQDRMPPDPRHRRSAARWRLGSIWRRTVRQRSRWAAVRTGVLVGVTNPKAFIILAAILPQFVDRSAGSVPAQMLLLAVVPVMIGLVTDSAWGMAAGAARAWFADRPRRLVLAGRAGGASMIALGASVALSGSHEDR
ncbi:MAG: hypothetical protein GEU86_09970 [Actinophytocola sp.]|nr:hypothetical protein [Actinophytocola sp.]